MTNETFLLMSDEEKNRKFKTALKNRTNNLLTEEEINIIMCNIPLKKQYVIRVYNDPIEFQGNLMLADGYGSKTLLGSMVAGASNETCSLFSKSKAAAIITEDNTAQNLYCLHIYIPHSTEVKTHG